MKFQFENLSEFINMGNRGPYVWASYFIVFAALIFMIITYLNAEKSANKTLKSLEAIKGSGNE